MTIRNDFEPDVDFGALEEDLGPFNKTPSEEFGDRVSIDAEGLLYLGYLTEDFALYGHKFVIKTLTRGDQLAITLVTKEWEDTLGMADAYETAFVSASLLSVDGRPVNLPLSQSEEPIVRLQANFETVKKWYEELIGSIYERCMALDLRKRAAFVDLQSK